MSYPAFHGVSQMAMYACPSLRNCANQGMYPPAVSNRPPKEKKPEKGPDIDLIYRQVEDKLKSIMGTKVVINQKDKNKGRVEIEYYSESELERIVELIESIR